MTKNKIMLAGLPGRMATMIGNRILAEDDLELSKIALAEKTEMQTIMLNNQKRTQPSLPAFIELAGMDKHRDVIADEDPDLIIDFTHPDGVNRNAKLYCESGKPFVMGTTGGDRERLIKTVEESDICAVIAPNMAPQIVAFQALIEYGANTFPDAFKGYSLVIKESHQKGKADTSGTAKAMAAYFNKLGVPFKADDIIKVRDPVVQKTELGVPEEFLSGHGWHSYYILSKNGNVRFKFEHNVNGRETYVDGTMLAVRFILANKYQKGKVFSMIDVLKAGQSQ